MPWLRPGETLFPWQERNIRWALPKPGVNFWWVGGAGKSIAALLLGLLHGGPVLWVTMAHLRPNVAREIKKRTVLAPHVVETGTEIPLAAPIVVAAWQAITPRREELVKYVERGGTVLFDEIQCAKQWRRTETGVDPETGGKVYRELRNTSSSAAALGRAAERRVGMTGTPVGNLRSDLWSQLDIVEPDCWGDNWAFTHRYCDAHPRFIEGVGQRGLDATGRSHTDELKARMREITSVVKKKEVATVLPPMRRELLYLTTKEQCRPPAGMADWIRSEARRGRGALLEAKISEAAARKRKWVVDFVKQRVAEGAKIVVFTGRRLDTEVLGDALRGELGDCPLWVAHGEHPAAFRDDCAEAYMSVRPGPAVLVGTTDSFGTGMNLQDTDDAVFVMLPYTWERLGQAEWRFTRPGQTRPVTLRYIVAEGTYDEDVVDILLAKLDGVTETIDDDDAAGVRATLSGDFDDEAIIAQLLERL